MKTVLWVSRIPPLDTQIGILYRMLNEEIRVVHETPPNDPGKLVARYKKGDFDEMVAALPSSFNTVLTALPPQILLPVMLLEPNHTRADVRKGGQGFRCIGFMRAEHY